MPSIAIWMAMGNTSATMYVIPVHHFPNWHDSFFVMSPTDVGIEQDLEPFIIVH